MKSKRLEWEWMMIERCALYRFAHPDARKYIEDLVDKEKFRQADCAFLSLLDNALMQDKHARLTAMLNSYANNELLTIPHAGLEVFFAKLHSMTALGPDLQAFKDEYNILKMINF